VTALGTVYVVVALGLVAVAVVCVRSLSDRRDTAVSDLESELEASRLRLHDTQSKLETAEAERTASELLLKAAEAAPATPPGPAKVRPDRDAGSHFASQDRLVMNAVWRLQCLDLERDRLRAARLTTADPDGDLVGLAHGLQQEITRVREEIGTPGTFQSDLDREPDAAASLLLLHSVQSTLDFVARRCQAFDLYLNYRVHERRLAVTIVCDDFESEAPDDEAPGSSTAGNGGPVAGTVHTADAVATSRAVTEAAAIVGAIKPAGGRLVFDRDTDGRMRTHLSVPVR
jgi:hypothetical protein